MGNSLWRERPSDTDVRYDPDASDNLVDQAPIWAYYDESYSAVNFTYITDTNDEGGTFRQPDFYNLTSGSGWPYERGVFGGFRMMIIDGSRLRDVMIYFYPPAPVDFCEQDVPAGMANVVGSNKNDPTNTTAVCGLNGNVVFSEVFGVSSYDRNGEVNYFWSGMGPIYGGGSSGPLPPGFSGFAKPVGIDAVYTHSVYAIPGAGAVMTYSDTDSILRQGDVVKGSFGTGTSAAGFPVQYNTYIYSTGRLNDQTSFLEQIQQALKTYNITEDDVPAWMKNGGESTVPSCISKAFGGCPAEEDYCGPNGVDPSCTASPYQNPPVSMKPGPIAGFTILAIFVVAIIGYFFHRRSVKSQKKRLRKQFAQQIAKRVDLRGSISQLTPTDLLAEFKRIDQSVKGGTSDGFISREELWEFVSSGKAGEMSEKDFNLLFDSMDIKGRGKVNFVEFCAFMSSCGEEIHELAKEEKEGYSRDEKLDAASRRISTRKLDGGGQQEDALAGNSSPAKSKNMSAVKWMHGTEAKAQVIDV
jgi:hypothetical protein